MNTCEHIVVHQYKSINSGLTHTHTHTLVHGCLSATSFITAASSEDKFDLLCGLTLALQHYTALEFSAFACRASVSNGKGSFNRATFCLAPVLWLTEPGWLSCTWPRCTDMIYPHECVHCIDMTPSHTTVPESPTVKECDSERDA